MSYEIKLPFGALLLGGAVLSLSIDWFVDGVHPLLAYSPLAFSIIAAPALFILILIGSGAAAVLDLIWEALIAFCRWAFTLGRKAS